MAVLVNDPGDADLRVLLDGAAQAGERVVVIEGRGTFERVGADDWLLVCPQLVVGVRDGGPSGRDVR